MSLMLHAGAEKFGRQDLLALPTPDQTDTHKPIVYPFAVTAASKNPNAEAFLAYLKSPPAAKIFEGEGFAVLAK